jgi:cellulose synthase/poly-beta-1,6-N-acetylglucosamine synthase-like glycosyltransferase
METTPAPARELPPLLSLIIPCYNEERTIDDIVARVLYFWHSVANGWLTTLSNMMSNLNLTDMETCYKMFRREVIQAVPLHD